MIINGFGVILGKISNFLMASGVTDMTVIHFRETHYRTHGARSRADNWTGPFTVTVISQQGSGSESARLSIGSVWPPLFV